MFELATKWVQPSKFYGINSLIVLFYVIQVVATAIPTCEAKISEYKLKKVDVDLVFACHYSTTRK